MKVEVTKLKRKFSNRKEHYKYAEELLLDAIFTVKGGPTRLGKELNVTLEAIINWRRRGFVPLENLFLTAAKLNVPTEALNYKDVSKYKIKYPSFRETVKRIKFIPTDIQSRILKLPRKFK